MIYIMNEWYSLHENETCFAKEATDAHELNGEGYRDYIGFFCLDCRDMFAKDFPWQKEIVSGRSAGKVKGATS